MQPTAALRVDDVRLTFARGRGSVVPVLGGVSLEVAEGEFVSLVGPSGCGKTTLFNVISGLAPPDSGGVSLKGREITGQTGMVAYMMQHDLLLPWRKILQNVLLYPEVEGHLTTERRHEAEDLLRRFGLGGFEAAYPQELSGGMRQRAALLRTILSDRDVVLLDEPFGALDALTRSKMHEWLVKVWDEFRRTMVLITHDIEEAIFLSDRVMVLTARPTSICRTFAIDLPRPRTHEILGLAEFSTLKKEILDQVWAQELAPGEGGGEGL